MPARLGAQDLTRIAIGISIILKESVGTAPVLSKLKSGDFGGSASLALRKFIDTAADITGLTRGRIYPYPENSEGSARIPVLQNGSGSNIRSIDEDRINVGHRQSWGKSDQTGGSGELYDVSREAIDIAAPGVEPVPAKTQMHLDIAESTISKGANSFPETGVDSDSSASPSSTNRTTARGTSSTNRANKRRARERRVPATPFGRVLGFAGLGAGLAWGTVQESMKRLWGGTGNLQPGESLLSPFLNENNAERLAVGLCRMRGAALKLGQMLSIQDETVIPPSILAALETVRQGADIMPKKQLYRVISSELGLDWKDHLQTFDDQPIAAASIGQVHKGVLKTGEQVAIKIQYPGVADSIDSDIDNVRRLLDYSNLVPQGLYLEQAMKVAKAELARECDYELEACNQKKFKSLIAGEKGFYVPKVFDKLCSKRVLTTELVSGVPIDKVVELDQHVRNHVASLLLKLTLQELFEFRFMQTDPNWSNFLYDESLDTINLIDFGAAREYPKSFVDDYLRMVVACAEKDRDKVVKTSIKLGFLTGEESRIMLDAHTEASFVVGLPFAEAGGFNFGSTDLTRRVTSLGATMLRHRLKPPPEEAYSLHRKLSGAFLACIKLKSVVNCREMLFGVYKNYKFTEEDL